jgi:hypothetical protein
MRDFACPNCGQHLAFENSVCLSCGSALGFSLDDMALLVIASGEGAERGGAVVSSYAAMHPAEDWAETFAHYLHIRDTLDTAAAFGFAAAAATFERRVLGPSGFDTIIAMWLPLAWGVEHGEPLDGTRRPLPVRAARRGAGEDAIHPQHHRRGDLRSGQAGLGRNDPHFLAVYDVGRDCRPTVLT